MRMFKLITNCVISVLLVLSVVLNIFILSVLGISNGESFRQVVMAKELATTSSSTETPEVAEATEPSTEITAPETTPTEPTTTTEPDTAETPDVTPIYQDENVKITYVRQDENLFGLEYKFLVENTSDRPLTITFSDLYIDGFKVDLSGLYCENLAIGAKSVESMILYQSEWEDFTTSPDRVEFKIKLINPKSLLTIYETSDRITFDL